MSITIQVQPIRRAYSREEIQKAAVEWMRKERRIASPEDDTLAKHYEKLGLLTSFLHDHFPAQQEAEK